MAHDPSPDTVDTRGPAALLAAARDARQVAREAEVDLLRTVVAWVAANPPEVAGEAATVRVGTAPDGRPHTAPLNEEGCPQIAAHAVAELAAVVGMSTFAGQSLISEALELAYRLRRIWARLLAGEVEPWRARRVARETLTLGPQAVEHVDRHLAAAVAGSSSWQLSTLVLEALAQFEPEVHQERIEREADHRDMRVRLDDVTLGGLVPVDGVLDLPDALDVDAALEHAAGQRRAWGDEDTPGGLRARAMGDLARAHLSWHGQETGNGELLCADGVWGRTGSDPDPGELADTCTAVTKPEVAVVGAAGAGSAGPARLRAADDPGGREASAPRPQPRTTRQVTLYLHLAEETVAALAGSPRSEDRGGQPTLGLGRAENVRRPVAAEAIRRWCREGGARVIVQPVIDTRERMATEAYEIPPRLAEQTRLRAGTCVFPYCTAPARTSDLDHRIPYDHDRPDEGGPTATENLAPLCRRHHGLKTRGYWRYERLEESVYCWWDRYRNAYRRDHRGTTALAGPDLPAAGASPP